MSIFAQNNAKKRKLPGFQNQKPVSHFIFMPLSKGAFFFVGRFCGFVRDGLGYCDEADPTMVPLA